MCGNFKAKKDNFEFFGLNFGKLPSHVQYFGSYNVDVVAESWVEVGGAEWRWVYGLAIPIEKYLQSIQNHLLAVFETLLNHINYLHPNS